VAFVVHFMAAEDLKAWEPGLASFTNEECHRLLDATHGLLEPFVVQRSRVRSANGSEATLTIIGAPFTPEQAIANLRSGCVGCRDLVTKSVEKARTMGCRVVGLGGYTSIVTDSGRDIVEDRLVLTSGNSLTVAAAHATLLAGAGEQGIDIARARLGVVGAAGNIGATLAAIAADRVGSIILVGRPGTRRHLQHGAAMLLASGLARVREGGEVPLIARALDFSPSLRRAARGAPPVGTEGWLAVWGAFAEEAGDDAPIVIRERLEALIECELVITATNAPRPIIKPEHIGTGPTVICDIAVPQDVDPAVAIERPLAMVLRGGRIRAPADQQVGFAPLSLPGGDMFGCLAETLVLGFAEADRHFSHGALSIEGVQQIAALAEQHGFRIAP
jgi:predicted amino acid dehydrogenase